MKLSVTVNEVGYDLDVDVRTTLLDLLRERLHLTGTKKGCDHGLCGACTVNVGGERVLACLSLAVQHDGAQVRTVEGLETDGELSPMQHAFLEHDAFQCGYCPPGQLMSAQALLVEYARGDLSLASFDVDTADSAPPGGAPCGRSIELSDSEIRERMAGNICRCGAYANIVAAIAEVSEGQR